jgi:hypothetical protein
VVSSEPPPDGGWDEAVTATGLPESDSDQELTRPMPPVVELSPSSVTRPNSVPPAAPTPRSVPPAPRTPSVVPAPSPALRGASPAPPPVAINALTVGMREEVWTIVRAALDEGLKPLVARQRELETRLADREREVGELKAREATRAAAPPPKAASVPVAFSLVPEPVFAAPKAPPLPRIEPARAEPAANVPDAAPPRSQRPGSIPPTGYGVSVIRGSKPEIDLAAIARMESTAMEGWDGGRRKKNLGRAVILLLLAGVVTAIVLTVLSHS